MKHDTRELIIGCCYAVATFATFACIGLMLASGV